MFLSQSTVHRMLEILDDRVTTLMNQSVLKQPFVGTYVNYDFAHRDNASSNFSSLRKSEYAVRR